PRREGQGPDPPRRHRRDFRSLAEVEELPRRPPDPGPLRPADLPGAGPVPRPRGPDRPDPRADPGMPGRGPGRPRPRPGSGGGPMTGGLGRRTSPVGHFPPTADWGLLAGAAGPAAPPGAGFGAGLVPFAGWATP